MKIPSKFLENKGKYGLIIAVKQPNFKYSCIFCFDFIVNFFFD